MNDPIIKSMLDTDLYHLTQQNAICKLYPRAHARLTFINRGQNDFPEGFGHLLREQIDAMTLLQLTENEAGFLQDRLYFLDPVYIDFLRGYRFNPAEVYITQSDGHLSITIEGPLYRTILWETPILALISELYFNHDASDIKMTRRCIDNLSDIQHNAKEKAHKMSEAGAQFMEFGTRRRYSYRVHAAVVEAMIGDPSFLGTSNVHLAHRYNIKTLGTQAHLWYMFHAAKYGFHMANKIALGRWVDIYNGDLGTALTDTFGTDAFFRAFDTFYAKLYDGCRQDSSNPIKFGEKAIAHYKKLHIDPMTKTIVFSDGLDIDEAIRIHKHFKDKVKPSFGIGTSMTNSVGAVPLNIVIKMTACKPDGPDGQWIDTIKLSDTPGKHTGNPEMIDIAKKVLNI